MKVSNLGSTIACFLNKMALKLSLWSNPEAREKIEKAKMINEKFLMDLEVMLVDVRNGVNYHESIDRLNNALISLEADKIILEGKPECHSLDAFEIAVLRTKVAVLEHMFINIANHDKD